MKFSLQSMVFLAPPLELLFLLVLSKTLLQRIAIVLQSILKRSTWAYYALAFMFLPGTYIHELSHFIFAKLLFVPTFHFSIWPKIEKHDIRLGSVEIAKTDFVRRFLIGSAPFLVGTTILVGSMYLFITYHQESNWLAILIEAVLSFQIGNTMFMSKRDLEGSWKVAIASIFIVFLLYIFGFDFTAIPLAISPLTETFKHISFYLSIPIVIDIVLIIVLGLFI